MNSGLIGLVASTVLLAAAVPTRALVLAGGKAPGESKKIDKASDCWVGLEVPDAEAPKGNKKNKVIQRACNNTCTFDPQVCVNEPTKKCTTVPALTGITVDNPALVPPTDLSGAHACGASGALAMTPGQKLIVNVTASSASGGPDADKFIFICKKNKKNKGCGTTSTTIPGMTGCTAGSLPDSVCPKNTAGGPDEVVFTTLDHGTDLDNGWTGVSQNFPVPSSSQLKFCLSGCDAAGTTMCTGSGPTGSGTINSTVFGPPLPLIAGGVAVCVINVFSAPTITGMANPTTGAMAGEVDLHSQVFITDQTKVCPRCETGTCDSGLNQGHSCHVDGVVPVVNSLASNKTFHLSKDCPPNGTPIATLTIPLPITTGTDTTPGTGGSKPCRQNEAQGVPVADDGCSSGCGTDNCTGNACTSMIPDPSNPSHMICVDVKGGLSQGCCNDNPAVPCFPTRPGGVGIVRTGRPVTPMTVTGATGSFPKVSSGEVTVATFCIAATGNSNIDTVTGLPGPGAVVFNTDACWTKAP
jgi:hypothetical protein